MNVEKFKEKVLEIVGAQWVFDDPVDRYAYARNIGTDGLKRYTEMMPEFSVFPGTTADTQKIVRLKTILDPANIQSPGIGFLQ